MDLDITCSRLPGEAANLEITNHCMPKLEKGGSPRECTPGFIWDTERVRGKHKCTKYKGTIRDCRGAEAINVCACCEWTGYTESVALALYTRPHKRTFSCTGSTSDTIVCYPECATHHEDHTAADFGSIFSEKGVTSMEEEPCNVEDEHGHDSPEVGTGVEVT